MSTMVHKQHLGLLDGIRAVLSSSLYLITSSLSSLPSFHLPCPLLVIVPLLHDHYSLNFLPPPDSFQSTLPCPVLSFPRVRGEFSLQVKLILASPPAHTHKYMQTHTFLSLVDSPLFLGWDLKKNSWSKWSLGPGISRSAHTLLPK